MPHKTTLILAAWGIAVLAMFGQLVAYSAQPGAHSEPPIHWPSDTTLQRNAERWTVLIFAHPHCPCTRATLAEFARLQALHQDKMDASIVLYHPGDQEPVWTQGAISTAAHQIEGLNLVYDAEGTAAQQFGVQTSGHVLAYAPDGSLAYSGGLTMSRGHEGLAQGTLDLRQALQAPGASSLAEYPVFGCPIVDDTDACSDGGCSSP